MGMNAFTYLRRRPEIITVKHKLITSGNYLWVPPIGVKEIDLVIQGGGAGSYNLSQPTGWPSYVAMAGGGGGSGSTVHIKVGVSEINSYHIVVGSPGLVNGVGGDSKFHNIAQAKGGLLGATTTNGNPSYASGGQGGNTSESILQPSLVIAVLINSSSNGTQGIADVADYATGGSGGSSKWGDAIGEANPVGGSGFTGGYGVAHVATGAGGAGATNGSNGTTYGNNNNNAGFTVTGSTGGSGGVQLVYTISEHIQDNLPELI